jgi:hypothetical protein
MLPLPTVLRTLCLFVILIGVSVISGCSGEGPTDSEPLGNVKLEAVLKSSSVSSTIKDSKDDITLGNPATVDSMQITKLRLLAARTVMRRDRFGSTDGSGAIRNSAMILTADAGNPRWYAEGYIPNGTYTHLEFEVAKLVPDATYDENYAPFLDGGVYSMIVEGWYYRNGEKSEFRFTTDEIPTIQVKFEPSVVVAAGATHTVVLTIDPTKMFSRNGQVLDPTDDGNLAEINAGVAEIFESAAER